MKKTISYILIALLSALTFAFGGCSCSSSKGAEIYNPAKFTESIDLERDYVLVWQDEFDEELDRNIWADTRQGTRRDGFWTLNLAYTDGEGHLVIRTEKRGSRFCSDTLERQITGAKNSTVTLKYDDCYPFALIDGEFGDISSIGAHTEDLVGYVILDQFDILGETFDDFLGGFTLPESGTTYRPTIDETVIQAYTPFYDTAMELYNYYSFVVDTKTVKSTLGQSALIGVNTPYEMVFGEGVLPSSASLTAAVAHLFGYASEEAFRASAEILSDTYLAYAEQLENGGDRKEALENGCFRGEDCFIFPIAVQNKSCIVLTYVIVDKNGLVSVWINDVASALKATNNDASHFAGATVTNETYCKNTLFVSGPEGVYSGAIRTMPLVDHEGNVKCEGYMHTYAYYEIRCKLPDTVGIWHAFWMQCGNTYSEVNGSADGVEVDVFEYLPARDAVNVALHWDGYDEAHKNDHKRYEKTHLSDGEYHTFGMERTESAYVFYIDGKKVYSTTGGGICDLDGYLLISTEYGEWGSWVGKLDIGDLPVDWIIDYVRVYDRKAA